MPHGGFGLPKKTEKEAATDFLVVDLFAAKYDVAKNLGMGLKNLLSGDYKEFTYKTGGTAGTA